MSIQLFIINIFDFLFPAIYVLIFVRIILSWMPNVKNGFTQIVFDITEPILKPFRIFNPKSTPLDFSPIIVILLLYIIRNILARFI